MANGPTQDAPRGADPAQLRTIRRHLASFLPTELLERFWHEGFATTRQPSFRLNTLRLYDAAATTASSASAAAAAGTGANRAASVPSPTPAEPAPACGHRGGCGREAEEAVVRQLLEGFGLPGDTPLERCPYHPLARLLPARAAAAVRVAEQAHTLAPLRRGSVYFMGLSSMLPALALMAHTPRQHPHAHPHAHTHAHQQQVQAPRQAGQPDRGGLRSGGSGDGGGGIGGVPASALLVLDLCAAPGGKTALLAELMGNKGTLLAVDASWPRMQRLKFNVERLVPNRPNHRNDTNRLLVGGGGDGGGWRGATSSEPAAAADGPLWRRGCVVAVRADGTQLRVDEHGLPLIQPRPSRKGGRGSGGAVKARRVAGAEGHDADEGEFGLYDRVLVDAPCSGLGRLQLQRPGSYRQWDEGHVARHPERQRQLLLRGARLLRRGGSLVYSTCTLDPRENEAVVAWLLGRTGGALRLVQPRLLVPDPLPLPGPHPHRQGAAGGSAPETTGAAATPGAAAAGAAAGLLLAQAPPRAVPLREALEGHRPGCTYDPLVEGPWWEEATDPWVAHGGGGGGGGGSHHHELSGLRLLGGPGPRSVGALGAVGGGMGRGTGAAVQGAVAACCVRVAPGPSYEGFFLAQFVRE